MQPGPCPSPHIPVRPSLLAKMKAEWTYDAAQGAFVSDSTAGQVIDPSERLPAGSHISRTAPQLAGRDPAGLSPDETNLARYVHLILPEGTSAPDYLAAVQAWPCFDTVSLPPDIRLPQ